MSYAANQSLITTLHRPLECIITAPFSFEIFTVCMFLQISDFIIEAQINQNSQFLQSPNIFYCLDIYSRFVVPMKGHSKPEDKFQISGKEN